MVFETLASYYNYLEDILYKILMSEPHLEILI